MAQRARILRLALLLLYLAAAFLAAASLIGAVSGYWIGASHVSAWALSVAGVLSILLAACALIREASVSLGVVEAHAREIRARSEKG